MSGRILGPVSYQFRRLPVCSKSKDSSEFSDRWLQMNIQTMLWFPGRLQEKFFPFLFKRFTKQILLESFCARLGFGIQKGRWSRLVSGDAHELQAERRMGGEMICLTQWD